MLSCGSEVQRLEFATEHEGGCYKMKMYVNCGKRGLAGAEEIHVRGLRALAVTHNATSRNIEETSSLQRLE